MAVQTLDRGLEFRRRKWTLAYYRFDQTKDGLVRAADFDQLAARVAAELGVASGTPAYDRLLRGYRSIWDFYFKPSDGDSDNTVTLPEHMANLPITFPADLQQQAIDANATIFAALDLDHDGMVEWREFMAFVRPWELPTMRPPKVSTKLMEITTVPFHRASWRPRGSTTTTRLTPRRQATSSTGNRRALSRAGGRWASLNSPSTGCSVSA